MHQGRPRGADPRSPACSAAASWRASAPPINTGGVGRGDSVAVIGCGGVGDAAIAGAAAGRRHDDHRRRHRRPEAASGPRSSAPPTRSTRRSSDPVEAIRELTGGFGADVVHRRGRPPGDVQAGVLRPRPRRHRRPGRRPDPGDDGRAAADRRLRPRRRAEVLAGTATACPAATSPCWSTSTCRAGSTSDAFVSETIALDDVEEAFDKMHQRRGAALGRGLLMSGDVRIDQARHLRHVLARRRHLGRRQQRLDRRRRHRGDRHRRRPRRRRRSPRPSATGASWRSCARTRTTTTSTRRPTLADATGAPILLHPDDLRRCGTRSTRTARPTASSPTATLERRRAPSSRVAAHARATRPARVCLYAPELGDRLQRRHAVQGRAGRHRPVVLRLPDRSSSRSATGCSTLPAGHDRPHRPRRRHHDRRRGARTWRSGSPGATEPSCPDPVPSADPLRAAGSASSAHRAPDSPGAAHEVGLRGR